MKTIIARNVPPVDERGVPVALRRVLVDDPVVVMGLEGAVAYSTGVQFDVTGRMRRHNHTDTQWAALMAEVVGTLPPAEGTSRYAADRRFSIVLDDGRTVAPLGPREMSERDRRAWLTDEPEEPGWVLTVRSSGMTEDPDHEWNFASQLWLRPLPPAGAPHLTWQWPALDLVRSSVEIDAARLLQASQGAVAVDVSGVEPDAARGPRRQVQTTLNHRDATFT